MLAKAIPKLERKFAVHGCKRADKVVFECLNGIFGCIYMVVVWLEQHQNTLVWGEMMYYYIVVLIVHHIQFDDKPFNLSSLYCCL